MLIRTTYLDCIYRPDKYKQVYARLLPLVKEAYDSGRFDAVAFSGSSGGAMAYPICLELGIPMVHARKPGAMGHCHGTVEGLVTVNNYAVIDDFIQSGRTLRFIRKAVSDSSVYMTCCTNVFLYNNPDSDEVGRNKVLRIFDNEPIVHMFYID